MSDLVFENIRFGYDKPIFDDLNLTFEAGLQHSLIGPNASGKSTLLRLATGLVKPTIGKVRIGSVDIHRLSSRDRAQTVAVVPQFETNVFPLTVRELVSTGRYCRQSGYFAGHDDPAVDEAISRTGISHLADRSVWDLSGGERQRTLIARALAQEAKWLLLDEATTFLDIRAEYQLLQLLAQLHDEGLSLISVTHDLQAAAKADWVTLLSEGGIEQGPPEELLTEKRLSGAYGVPIFVERKDGRILIGPA